MTAAEHRAACEKKRGGMTATERAIIHDLETLEIDYHMLSAEMVAVKGLLRSIAINYSMTLDQRGHDFTACTCNACTAVRQARDMTGGRHG